MAVGRTPRELEHFAEKDNQNVDTEYKCIWNRLYVYLGIGFPSKSRCICINALISYNLLAVSDFHGRRGLHKHIHSYFITQPSTVLDP